MIFLVRATTVRIEFSEIEKKIMKGLRGMGFSNHKGCQV